MKRVITAVAILLVAIVILFVAWNIKLATFFKGEIIDGIYLVQRPFQGPNTYDITSRKHDIQIENIGEDCGWIIEGNWLYGSAKSEPHYYAYNLESRNLARFTELHQLNQFLIEHDLPRHNMTDEESIVHLKYHRGKQRKYPLKE